MQRLPTVRPRAVREAVSRDPSRIREPCAL